MAEDFHSLRVLQMHELMPALAANRQYMAAASTGQ
jgi:hypothetical protein